MFRHPKNVCLTYFSHLKFSMYLSKEFAKASAIAAIHGIYPDSYITHSSDTITKLQSKMNQIGCRKKQKNNNS